MEKINSNLCIRILSHLPLIDLVRSERVCKRFKYLITSHLYQKCVFEYNKDLSIGFFPLHFDWKYFLLERSALILQCLSEKRNRALNEKELEEIDQKIVSIQSKQSKYEQTNQTKLIECLNQYISFSSSPLDNEKLFNVKMFFIHHNKIYNFFSRN